MEKFSEFITEVKEEPYRFVLLWHSDPSDPDAPEKTADDLIAEGKKLGCEGFKVDIDGAYSDIVNGKRYIYRNSLDEDDDEKFLVDRDTLVFVRAPATLRRPWMDLMSQFEREEICCVNNRHCMEITTDKYRTHLVLAEEKLNQPKTILIHQQNKSMKDFDRLGSKFPIVLKTISGSVGVGVILIESEAALHATVQILHKLDNNMGLLIQEFIPTKFDVRVQVIGGKIHGAIKRPVVDKDFRSNVSLGSVPEKFELTELEKKEVIQATKAVDGLWVGVDFIPGKNREKDSPFFLEINSTPGTKGYKKATKSNITGDVIKTFINRDTWLRTKPFDSVYNKS